MVSPQSSHVDGKVWAQNNGFAGIHRLDLATGKIETWEPFKSAKEPHNIYDVIPDSKNNVFFTDFRLRHIGRLDAKTGEVKMFEVPTAGVGAAPRPDGCAGPAVVRAISRRPHRACSTPRPRQFKEWRGHAALVGALRRRSSTRTSEAWTGSMLSDQVTRLNTKTGDDGAVSAAALDQHPARVRRQLNDAGHLLGRQQPRRFDRQARAAGLKPTMRRNSKERHHVGKTPFADRRRACADRLCRRPRRRAQSETAAALTGTVSSAKEGLMEGVVVSAKKTGSTITISVATDDKGRFSFPATGSSPASTRSASAPSATTSKAREAPTSRPADGERRDQARADQEPGQADVQRRMVRELSGHRRREEGDPQLRELPQPRPHRALAIRRRAVRRHLQPHGRLLPGQHAGASAAARRQRAALARPGPQHAAWSRSISPRSI